MEKRDSLVNLLMGTSEEPVRPKPPSAPKPRDKGTRLRRASSISPYLTPTKVYNRATIQPKSGSVQAHRRRKSHGGADLSTDFAGKNAFDLRDELTTACRKLRERQDERDGLKYEVMKLKGIVEKKEKEIEDLLAGGYIGQKDRTRLAGTSTRQENLLALSSLKHRVHILERNLRMKDEELSNLRKDIKTSRLKELEAEKEVYYSEVLRLQGVTDKLLSELDVQVPQSKKHLRTKIDELSRIIKKLKDRISKISMENSILRRQLGRWKEGGVTMEEHETDERKRLFLKYCEMTQGDVITSLIDREMKIQELDGKLQSLSKEQEETRSEYKNTIDVKKNEISELDKTIANLKVKLSDLEKENTSLGNQCAEYRTSIEKTRQELSDTTESLNTLQTNRTLVESEVKGLKEAQRNEEIAREHLRHTHERKRKTEKRNHFLQHQAASVIQRTWKHHISMKKQRIFETDSERIATLVQSLLRSHHLRTNFIKQEEATTVTCIQNIFRGHRTREIYSL